MFLCRNVQVQHLGKCTELHSTSVDDTPDTIAIGHYNEAIFSAAAPFCDLTGAGEGCRNRGKERQVKGEKDERINRVKRARKRWEAGERGSEPERPAG